MGQTRAALTEKLETLENRVFGTVHDTTNSVSNTVQNVRDTVQDVRATLAESLASVRDALDLTRQVHRHPWLMMGGSVFAGYVGGRILESVEAGRFPLRLTPSTETIPYHPAAEVERETHEPSLAPARSGSSFFQSLADTFAPEIAKLKGMSVGVAVGLMRDKINEALPSQLQENVTDLMDRFTVKLGGEPTPPGSLSGNRADAEERDGPQTRRSTARI
jgi:hypothetical protein